MLSEFLANRPGKPPQMLPLRTPECEQGDRQLLPFPLSKPYNKSETNLKILEGIFLRYFTQGNTLLQIFSIPHR